MKRTFTSIGAALLMAVFIWLIIVTLTPTMNNEKAGNIIVLSSIATGIATALLLWLRDRRHREK